eukprot:3780382-Alexandrium_andersonii.AAC.1
MPRASRRAPRADPRALQAPNSAPRSSNIACVVFARFGASGARAAAPAPALTGQRAGPPVAPGHPRSQAPGPVPTARRRVRGAIATT